MRNYKIAVIPGDGIGPEVVSEGIKVLNTIQILDKSIHFEFETFQWGCEYYLKNGIMMENDGMEKLKCFDAIYLGAIGHPEVPDHISLGNLLLRIRRDFEQYINLRPIKLLNGAFCPLKDKLYNIIDIKVVRENSEGEYSGAGSWLYKDKPEELVLQTGVFSRKGTERVIRYAFELAKREKKTLTSISKANALNYSMVFWDKIFYEVANEYKEVKTNTFLIDAACMYFVTDPSRFEIVVASNLFGDIVTDLGAAIAGGIGLAAGANVNPERRYPSMFEPIHGSAPDIAGKNVANPLAAIWSVSQLLEFLGHVVWSKKIMEAIKKALSDTSCLTPDMGGDAMTYEVGDKICSLLKDF